MRVAMVDKSVGNKLKIGKDVEHFTGKIAFEQFLVVTTIAYLNGSRIVVFTDTDITRGSLVEFSVDLGQVIRIDMNQKSRSESQVIRFGWLGIQDWLVKNFVQEKSFKLIHGDLVNLDRRSLDTWHQCPQSAKIDSDVCAKFDDGVQLGNVAKHWSPEAQPFANALFKRISVDIDITKLSSPKGFLFCLI